MEQAQQSPDSPYPISVTATLDSPPGRWIFLIKLLLALPHYVVLIFLWLAFAVVTIIAFFAILIKGRYPRRLFNFNVGVMRWGWRVGFYSFDALATDRYPPFTLKDVEDYPARLSVEYPERLSRGLVLIKWWLLAIPHYLIVGTFQGGGGYRYSGLIFLLAIFAAVYNLFKPRYPPDIFTLLVGLNRWVYRMVGYAALMTDRYPPFRLEE